MLQIFRDVNNNSKACKGKMNGAGVSPGEWAIIKDQSKFDLNLCLSSVLKSFLNISKQKLFFRTYQVNVASNTRSYFVNIYPHLLDGFHFIQHRVRHFLSFHCSRPIRFHVLFTVKICYRKFHSLDFTSCVVRQLGNKQ